jgi:phytoene dehydrogenase-like protein
MRDDAIVIGSGPNGLACAIALALRGLLVTIYEASDRVGGALRSEALTLPGFTHDVFSACHPMAVASPFFNELPLHKYGLEWIYSPAETAHPLDGGRAVVLYRSVEKTAALLGKDEKAYKNFFEPLVKESKSLFKSIMGPTLKFPRHPFLLAKFGLNALLTAEKFAETKFITEEARALFGGIAAHSAIPLTSPASAAPGLILNIAAHVCGWPIPKGGAQNFARALEAYFKSLGGKIILHKKILTLDELPSSKFVFFDLTPKQILKIAGQSLPHSIQKGFENYKYGPGVFKMDWALEGPIPWVASGCREAATVHLGGSLSEIVSAEEGLLKNRESEKPYVLLCQPSLFDGSRAPKGRHTVWAYCHVPNGSTKDMSTVMENQIERFAPGFKKLILKKSVLNTVSLEALNSNLIGGDISGGLISAKQLIFRPFPKLDPYSIDGKKFWICSSSTPPGPGVHGMCGYQAAIKALGGKALS